MEIAKFWLLIFNGGHLLLAVKVASGIFVNLLNASKLNPISYGGGASEAPPPSGIGDCSKTHLYIDLKLLDFSYTSKTKIFKKKKNPIFLPHPPSEGGTRKIKFLKSGRRA